jgi:hypothetical protein
MSELPTEAVEQLELLETALQSRLKVLNIAVKGGWAMGMHESRPLLYQT